jgi:large subunit ribosomal protein L29
MKAKALQHLTDMELLSKADELSRSIFNLRVRATTKELDNYKKIAQERRELARVKTILRQREKKI